MTDTEIRVKVPDWLIDSVAIIVDINNIKFTLQPKFIILKSPYNFSSGEVKIEGLIGIYFYSDFLKDNTMPGYGHSIRRYDTIALKYNFNLINCYDFHATPIYGDPCRDIVNIGNNIKFCCLTGGYGSDYPGYDISFTTADIIIDSINKVFTSINCKIIRLAYFAELYSTSKYSDIKDTTEINLYNIPYNIESANEYSFTIKGNDIFNYFLTSNLYYGHYKKANLSSVIWEIESNTLISIIQPAPNAVLTITLRP